MFEGPCGRKSLGECGLKGEQHGWTGKIRVQEEGRCQAVQGPVGQGRESARSPEGSKRERFCFSEASCGYHGCGRGEETQKT